MNISIIIPNYNGEKLLRKNLPLVIDAVKNYKRGRVEIIIPDDPSTDNSKEVIEEFINSIKYENILGKTIENKDTKLAGFSKNVNRGVKISTGDILILFNSDVYPHKNFLEQLIAQFDDPNVFAVGCLDESLENGEIILRGRGLGSWQRGFLIHKAASADNTTTLWVSGGSGAFRKNMWDQLKGFDPIYDPFYWEDIDLSYRAQKSGYKILFEPESRVTHEHEQGVVKERFDDEFVRKISYRNQFIFIWKNITQANLLLSHILWLPYHFLKALINGDIMFFLGFSQAVLKLPDILKSRKFARKNFVRTDSETLKDYLE